MSDSSERFAKDLASVLVAQRGAEALTIARLVLMELAEMKGRAQCRVCGRDFKRSTPQQLYCGKSCRWRRQYLLQCAELGGAKR